MTYQNHIRDRMESGEAVFGAGTVTLSPVMIEVFAELGYDYVWLDHEHIGAAASHAPNFETVRRTADAVDIEPVVRIESGEGPVIRKLLDTGIRTFVVPRVETADDVRRAVRAARFEFDGAPGERGVGTALVNNWGDRPSDYTEREDETVYPGIMIENATALENIDEIFSVPHLGFARIGPSDLSVSMGHPLEQDHPEVREAIETILAAGEDHDVPVGLSAGYVGGVEAAVEMGSVMVTLGSEVGAARQVLSERLETGHDTAGRS